MSTRAESVTPPVESNNVIVRASVTSHERFKLPDTWRKAIVTIYADGVDVGVLFGGATVEADLAANTTLSGGPPFDTVTFDGNECKKIPSGSEKHLDLAQIIPTNARDVYISHIESATGGQFRMERTSGKANIG